MLRTGFVKPLMEHLMSFQCPSLVSETTVGRPLCMAEESLSTILLTLSCHPGWLAPLKGPWRHAQNSGDWLDHLMESLNRALKSHGEAWDALWVEVPEGGCLSHDFDTMPTSENLPFANEPRAFRLCKIIGEPIML